jgi:putative membrane protein
MTLSNENLIAPGEKKIFALILAFSCIVFFLVITLSFLPRANEIPSYAVWLPRINAVLNGTTSILLIFSFYYIKQKNILMHKRLNITAFILSSVFLLSYVWFHSMGIKTAFPAENPLRPLYLVILVSHIILAALVLPVVLFTFYLGLNMKVIRHRKIARWTFPLWLYVTVTGVIVYLMIAPYYRF